MLESCSWMFPGWQPNSRSNTSTLEMSSLFYFDLICVVCILHTYNSSAHAQSVTESLSLNQNKSLPFYLTLWDCLTCHYTHIYPIWPMNLSTYLSISRQKNPLCEKKFPYYTERYGRSAVPFLQRLLNEDYEKQRKNLKCQLQVNNDVTYNVPIT